MDISRIRIGVLLFAVAAGCGDSSNTTDGSSHPDLSHAAAIDQSMPADQSVVADQSILPDQSALPDQSVLPDLSMPVTGSCAADSDCRLFSSMCGSCKCIPLGKDDHNPPCNMPMVNCFVDPCLNKTAHCLNNTCAVQ